MPEFAETLSLQSRLADTLVDEKRRPARKRRSDAGISQNMAGNGR
jgi:hypothetical protein